MKYLKKFYEELEKKYNLNELTNDEILQKLYELANEKSGEYDYFMKGQGNRFFELA